MSSPASRERERLAAALEAADPQAPTLCEGWTAHDLVAHLVVREHRPDAAIGIVAPPMAGYGERVRRAYRDNNTYQQLIEKFRAGPPIWSVFAIPGVDGALNAVEFFVHAEDVRRGTGTAAPVPADEALQAVLWRRLRLSAPMLRRRAPGAITVRSDSGAELNVPGSSPAVTVSGPVGELTLFFMGRQAAAAVQVDGPAEAVAAVRGAKFGF
jgi:uncharacterized protein (TIGR03085 family)